LAQAYALGETVELDLVKAHGFANLAAARGLEEARLFRDALTQELDPARLAEAQAFAREWRAATEGSEG